MSILILSCVMLNDCKLLQDIKANPKEMIRMIPDKLTYHLILLKVGTIGEKTDAARWLGEHKIAIAVPLLCEALSSSEGDFRGWAACALGEIGEQSAIIPLQMALVREKKLFRRDRFAISLPNAYDSITWALDQLTGEH